MLTPAALVEVLRSAPPAEIAARIVRESQRLGQRCSGVHGARAYHPSPDDIRGLLRALREVDRRTRSRDLRIASPAGEPGDAFPGPSPLRESRVLRAAPIGPRPTDPRIEPRSAPIADHAGRSTSLATSGYFDLDFGTYEPPATSAARTETLTLVWYPYYTASARLSYEELHAMIRDFEAGTDASEYLFWTSGWGGAHRSFLHAMRLLDVYRRYITNTNADCPSARTEFIRGFYTGDYRIHVDNAWSCSAQEATITYQAGTAFPQSISYDDDNTGYYNSVNGTIHACTGFVAGQAHLADAFLAYAHRAYWYAMDGEASNIFQALIYLIQAVVLGRLALGAVSTVSRTLLHEMMHREFRGSHCSQGCCMQRIAFLFQCRIAAYLGLYAADAAGIDVNADGLSFGYASTCRRRAFAGQQLFSGSCRMNRWGKQGDSSAWSEFDPWTNPIGCP